MFGLFKRKHPVVFEQWITPVLAFESNADLFYTAVSEELKKWEVPDLSTERIEYKDGGPFSQGREYLRVQRENLVFDICSAKFGKSWWFSCRSAVLPRSLRVWELLVFVIALGWLGVACWYLFGVIAGGIAMAATLVMVSCLMLAGRSLSSLDDALLNLPVLGAFYEAWTRFESYYRDDASRMYVSMVDYLVREKVKEFAAAGGVDDVQFNPVKDPLQLVSLGDRIQGFIANTAKRLAEP
ncbi:MAG: hypothetical protein JNM99_10700 [Verrucomicrobiaceae bacterium]|nr:hypothetical protein [Verrucomicrobiaceae bacterium]